MTKCTSLRKKEKNQTYPLAEIKALANKQSAWKVLKATLLILKFSKFLVFDQ